MTPTSDPNGALERFYREGYSATVRALSRAVGTGEAEACVQEAFVRALRNWSMAGVPVNPSAWLKRVSRRIAIDHLRSRRRFTDAEVEELYLATNDPCTDASVDCGIHDETVRQLLACAVPELSSATRAMLMLSRVCGLSTSQIAAVFRMKVSAAAQRLVRSERVLTPGMIRQTLTPQAIDERMPSVMDAVYLTFSIGFHEAELEAIEAIELVDEGLRLATALHESAVGATPEVAAMVAAMLLQSSRLPARRDSSGRLLSLPEQDRSRWDQRRIDRGLGLLAGAVRAERLSEYHLHAGIAACHAVAASYAETNWREILDNYDALMELNPTPPTRLGRVVALSMAHGPAAGISEAQRLLDEPQLASDFRTYSLLGEIFSKLRRPAESRRSFQKAAKLAVRPVEIEYLLRRAREVSGET